VVQSATGHSTQSNVRIEKSVVESVVARSMHSKMQSGECRVPMQGRMQSRMQRVDKPTPLEIGGETAEITADTVTETNDRRDCNRQDTAQRQLQTRDSNNRDSSRNRSRDS
jgi:hypothetical protein